MLIIEKNKPTTVFDIVDKLQTGLRGHHFCALSMLATSDGITVYINSYQTTLVQTITQPRKELTFNADELPDTIEQLLQIIRESFPGIGFQFIAATFDGFDLTLRPYQAMEIDLATELGEDIPHGDDGFPARPKDFNDPKQLNVYMDQLKQVLGEK